MRSGYGSCTSSSTICSEGLFRHVCKLKSEVRDGDICFTKLTFELRGRCIQSVVVGSQETEFNLHCRNLVLGTRDGFLNQGIIAVLLALRVRFCRMPFDSGSCFGMVSTIRVKASSSVPRSGCQAQMRFVRATQRALSFVFLVANCY